MTDYRILKQTFVSTLSALVMAASQPGAVSAKPAEREDLKNGNAVVRAELCPEGHKVVRGRILINASPEIVWDTVHEERRKDPDLAYSKVLSQGENKNELTLEQKFVLLPVIGTATCVMSNIEVPLQRIDYKLLKSDHFKAMQGSWVLTPVDAGKSTILELSSFLDLNFAVPRFFIDSLTAKKLERRLNSVKMMAEKTQSQLAQKS